MIREQVKQKVRQSAVYIGWWMAVALVLSAANLVLSMIDKPYLRQFYQQDMQGTRLIVGIARYLLIVLLSAVALWLSTNLVVFLGQKMRRERSPRQANCALSDTSAILGVIVYLWHTKNAWYQVNDVNNTPALITPDMVWTLLYGLPILVASVVAGYVIGRIPLRATNSDPSNLPETKVWPPAPTIYRQ